MRVPFLDLRSPHEELRAELSAAFERVVESGWFVLGQEVGAFEEAWAASCETSHAIGVSNGLDAIHVALRAVGVGPGDEVIVPAHTFVASWLGVSYTGATPVPVAVREDTYNLDPSRVEAALTERTRAVVAVHLYGQPADMDPLMELAERRGLVVLEDAAQAHAATYHGRRAGSLGHVAAFSFYPGKNLGALGDAGAITTGDPEIADRCRVLRNYGSRRKYEHETVGYNARLDELQAALLRAKLPALEGWTARRREIAARYLEGLAGTDLVLPVVPPGIDPVWHLFVVRHPERDALQRRLEQEGIGTLIHYPVPPHRCGAYADLRVDAEQVRGAERLSAEVLSLPMGPHLSDAQVDEVIAALAR